MRALTKVILIILIILIISTIILPQNVSHEPSKYLTKQSAQNATTEVAIRKETTNSSKNFWDFFLYTIAGTLCGAIAQYLGEEPGWGLAVARRIDNQGGALGVLGDSFIIKKDFGEKFGAIGLTMVGGTIFSADQISAIVLGGAGGVRIDHFRFNLGIGYALRFDWQEPIYFVEVAYVML